MANLLEGSLTSLGGAVPSVHDQLQERLHSPGQRGRPLCRATVIRRVTAVLHPMVLLGLKHHPLHLQCFCCCHFLIGRER
jgi:hypothetical protein